MKPLSIEELKALKVGDFVWVVLTEIYPCYVGRVQTGYFKIANQYEDLTFSITELWLHTEDFIMQLKYSDYGKTWLSYKNKEQAEAKGEIVELLCTVGDTIYTLSYNSTNKQHHINTEKVTQTKFEYENGVLAHGSVYTLDPYDKLDTVHNMRKFGIRWFTDKAQAEARLQKLRGAK